MNVTGQDDWNSNANTDVFKKKKKKKKFQKYK